MKKLFTLIGLLTVFALGYSNDIKDVSPYEIVSTQVVIELNEVRSSGVVINEQLSYGADLWAYELKQNFDHDVMQTTGKFRSEVILLYHGNLDAKKIITKFLNSPEHRSIILDSDWRSVGVGIRRFGDSNYVVLRFN